MAHHLSTAFGWPILCNDVVRSEVKEDTLQPQLDRELYNARVVERIKELAIRPANLVYDASQDRGWERYLANFGGEPPYRFGVISFDLSREFYVRLLQAKQYDSTLTQADKLLADHTEFLQKHADTVICTITDANFSDRLQLAETAVRNFISQA